MAFCSQGKDSVSFDVTPVENLFIQEFLPAAPGDYVKVYLCALMQSRFPETAEPTAERFAAALGMDVQQVLDALRYWQRQGLVRVREGDASGFEVRNVRSAMYEGAESARESALYRYSELNAKIEQITGGRQFTPQEYDTIYDWIEVLGLTEEAVAELMRYGMSQSGKRLSIAKLSAIARDWQKKGILTGEKARAYLDGMMLLQSPAREVLREMGIVNRNPMMDEHRTWLKWHDEWGFSMDAVREACKAMKKIQNPNFDYLDKVLFGLHERGLHTVAQIRQSRGEEDLLKAAVQRVAYALGVRAVTPEHIRYYESWKALGLDDDGILTICRASAARSGGSFKDADSLVNSCVRRGLMTSAAIEADLQLESDLSRVFAAAGVRRAATEKDKENFARWLRALPFEVILEGAEYARDAEKPMAMLGAIVSRWQGEGVKTVADARASREKLLSRGGTKKDSVVRVDGNSSFDAGDLAGIAEEL